MSVSEKNFITAWSEACPLYGLPGAEGILKLIIHINCWPNAQWKPCSSEVGQKLTCFPFWPTQKLCIKHKQQLCNEFGIISHWMHIPNPRTSDWHQQGICLHVSMWQLCGDVHSLDRGTFFFHLYVDNYYESENSYLSDWSELIWISYFILFNWQKTSEFVFTTSQCFHLQTGGGKIPRKMKQSKQLPLCVASQSCCIGWSLFSLLSSAFRSTKKEQIAVMVFVAKHPRKTISCVWLKLWILRYLAIITAEVTVIHKYILQHVTWEMYSSSVYLLHIRKW